MRAQSTPRCTDVLPNQMIIVGVSVALSLRLGCGRQAARSRISKILVARPQMDDLELLELEQEALSKSSMKSRRPAGRQLYANNKC